MPSFEECPVCNLSYGDLAPCRCPRKPPQAPGAYQSCLHCNMLFSAGELAQHIPSAHRDQYRYFCNICSGLFNRPEQVAEHIARHSDQHPIYCVKCAMVAARAAHQPCPKSAAAQVQQRFQHLGVPGAPKKARPRAGSGLRGAHLSRALETSYSPPPSVPSLADLLASVSLAPPPMSTGQSTPSAAAGILCYSCQRIFPTLEAFQQHLPC